MRQHVLVEGAGLHEAPIELPFLSSFARRPCRTVLDMRRPRGAGGRVRALDFDDPRDHVYCFGKIWGSYDEPVYTAYHGTN